MKQHDGTPSSPESAEALWMRAALERYESPLTHYAARMLNGDVERARDVVQDTFLKLWTADRASVDGHLGQWLYRVCRNRALDVCKKEMRMTALTETQLSMQADSRSEADRHDAAPTCASAFAAMQTLPQRQQEVIRLKFQGGLSYREIANVMDLTVTHVGVLIHTGLKAIREKMIASGTGPSRVPQSEVIQ
ncbi:MAG: sigma-70 family RNA polymerase sigma factor [Phycisphaerales bacterium]|nr:sigma-70 family RNA polymerase sigma factor [Phycisphaerales bacterium]